MEEEASPILSIPDGINSLKKVVSEMQESLVETQDVEVVQRSADLAEMADKLAFQSFRFMTGADQLDDNNNALKKHTKAIENLIEDLPTNRALQKEVGAYENMTSQLRERLQEATQTNASNLVLSEERINQLTADSSRLGGENDLLRQQSDRNQAAINYLTRQNESAFGILDRLVLARNQSDVEILQREARVLLGHQELTTPTFSSGVVEHSDLSEPEQRKGNAFTAIVRKSKDAYHTLASSNSLSSMKRKHARSSPLNRPTPGEMRQILAGPAGNLPNDQSKPEVRGRPYIIIDCSSRARLENSILHKTTLDRILTVKRDRSWEEILKRIATCRERVRGHPRVDAPKCLVHSCHEAGCGWTFDAYDQNHVCDDCAAPNNKTWKTMQPGESPQCLKAPAEYPNELWLLNPRPDDFEKQHAFDVENSERQEEPISSPTRKAHTRKESGDGPLSKITKLMSTSSHASLSRPERQLRSQTSRSTLRGGEQFQLPSRDLRIPSEPSNSGRSRDPAWGIRKDDPTDYDTFLLNAGATGAGDPSPPSDRGRPPASEISVSSSFHTARASATDRFNHPPMPSLSQQSLDQPASMQYDVGHPPRPTTRGHFQPARPNFPPPSGTWGR